MKRSIKGNIALLGTILAFAAMAYAPSRVYAQDGPCCAQIAHTTVTCGDSGCKGTVTYNSCTMPLSPNSQHWKVLEIKCCTASYEDYNVGVGGNGCTDNASTPPTALNVALYAEGFGCGPVRGNIASFDRSN
ncbi:MAG TPA: hypothetical protein VHU83_09215 [Bryobacteraceae bacterium]|jgi:hypothetical protein|nr:hypothetical protein [Bryobacteraceae bacterium]